ncbi:hypothetical protein [Psychroserpens sp. SPM9]|uniref:hypothetical protein n=1 Tax=Psychroserpens sp. SPM9 TaxID=2975598 RepID=UPI0021A58308|nr:hypothetical protein [Psychroserpens sp. SPM9]MDG5491190.1 hypothetical protein [Psychroserpens sp. SPM9]
MTWIHTLESFNTELDHLSVIEKQLVKNTAVLNDIQNIRRKNVLSMANLCKYEQELKTEYEYGQVEYGFNRLKVHEQKREHYLKLIEAYTSFKNQFYLLVRKYKR